MVSKMAVYVLVHGGFVGGWIWDTVSPRLEAAGHTVYAPTLTGLAGRSHPPGPPITLDTHAEDVIGLIKGKLLDAVILVGHSYSGMVITVVAERIPERIGRLVYLDALVPEDGCSLTDYMPAGMVEQFKKLAEESGGHSWVPMPFPPQALGLTSEEVARWFLSKTVDHPLQTAFERVEVRSAAAANLPRTFIYCTSPALGLFDDAAARARRSGWRYRELATGHLPQVTAPGEVARLLLEAAT